MKSGEYTRLGLVSRYGFTTLSHRSAGDSPVRPFLKMTVGSPKPRSTPCGTVA
ncbi:hypothetical protein Shyhy01_19710 [Streptomyces hygroscopicus subsp. hygroscopicus]|nr:hypothetical protein Shyhy01_19710 [Streptomyces hygroscopicus subsp. hygroscopicus]